MEELYRGIWVVAYRELLRFTRERSRLVGSFGMPLFFLVVFGAGFNRFVGDLTPGVDFIRFVYPGIIALTVLMPSLFSGLSVVWDREFGFLKEILVAPLNRAGVAVGKAAGGATVALIQGLLLLLLAPFLGIPLSPLLLVELAAILVVLTLTLASLGILIASQMRSQQGFQVVMPLVMFPLLFLSGVFYPVSSLPSWLAPAVKVNPVTYGVDVIRQLMLSGEGEALPAVLGVSLFGRTMGVLEETIIIALLGLLLMSLAVWSFSRQE